MLIIKATTVVLKKKANTQWSKGSHFAMGFSRARHRQIPGR